MVSVRQLLRVGIVAWCVAACESTSTFQGEPEDGLGGSGGNATADGSSETTGGGSQGVVVTSQRPCNSTADCLSDFPRCEQGLCASCVPADHAGCGAELPFCLSADGQPPLCVECREDSDCAEGDCVASACVTSCRSDTDCGTDASHCSQGGVCVECGPGAACQDPSLSCSETGKCVECVSDAECPASSPACREGACSCELDINQLSTDRSNCGACGVACPAGEICAGGSCSKPTRSRFTLVAGGGVSKSDAYTLVFSAGEAPAGNAVLSREGARLRMGFVGASSE